MEACGDSFNRLVAQPRSGQGSGHWKVAVEDGSVDFVLRSPTELVMDAAASLLLLSSWLAFLGLQNCHFFPKSSAPDYLQTIQVTMFRKREYFLTIHTKGSSLNNKHDSGRPKVLGQARPQEF